MYLIRIDVGFQVDWLVNKHSSDFLLLYNRSYSTVRQNCSVEIDNHAACIVCRFALFEWINLCTVPSGDELQQ